MKFLYTFIWYLLAKKLCSKQTMHTESNVYKLIRYKKHFGVNLSSDALFSSLFSKVENGDDIIDDGHSDVSEQWTETHHAEIMSVHQIYVWTHTRTLNSSRGEVWQSPTLSWVLNCPPHTVLYYTLYLSKLPVAQVTAFLYFAVRLYDGSELSKHPSRCFLGSEKQKKSNPGWIFLWRSKVSEAMCQWNSHNVRLNLFF